MNVMRASQAGFCMGVALALKKLDQAIANKPLGKVRTMGSIIHNPQVLEEYAKQGVKKIDDPNEAEAETTVLIRAHGIPRQAEATLLQKRITLIDATCPRVKKAQLAIAEATITGASLLLFGEEYHPEVRGLISYANGKTLIFADQAELQRMLPVFFPSAGSDGQPYVLAAQTTQGRAAFESICAELSARLGARLTVLDTICDATRQRQEEMIRLAAQVEIMVVVGGKESGNTKRLAEIAAMHGTPTLQVETAEEIKPEFFRSFSCAGLTAGASTPKSIIDEVEQCLHAL